jgi:hypothetical protein
MNNPFGNILDNDDIHENYLLHHIAAAQVIINNNIAIALEYDETMGEDDNLDTVEGLLERLQHQLIDHRTLPRNPKREFNHARALMCIQHDYLGVMGDPRYPLFNDKQFSTMFRLSRSRVQKLFEDVMNNGIPFYFNRRDAADKQGASLEAKILLPLKTFAYGVPPHTFIDYFQMSESLARTSCEEFCSALKTLYAEEYLRVPTAADLRNIVKLHKAIHGIHGIFGALDCMHIGWKNCPVAWQGNFKSGNNKKGATVVLEALSDYHTWFWHASFGYAGSLNDLNILNISPFLERLLDGSFRNVELQSGVVPFSIAGELFNYLLALVDGIYPPYSRFIKAVAEPLLRLEKLFTGWQESARKDVERAFGILQGKFQVLARPMHGHSLEKLSDIVSACLIMHNMSVSDRVMDGDLNATYNPAHRIDEIMDVEEPDNVGSLEFPSDMNVGDDGMPELMAEIGLRNGHPIVIQNMLDRQDHWDSLDDDEEHGRLHRALLRSQHYKNQ